VKKNPYRQTLKEIERLGHLGHTSKSVLHLQTNAWDEGYKAKEENINEEMSNL